MSRRVPLDVPFGFRSHETDGQRVGPMPGDKANGTSSTKGSASVGRPRLSTRSLAEMAIHLEPRDLDILRTLRLVGVASAIQLERLHFRSGTQLSNARLCRKSLRHLSDLRLIGRLERSVGGQGRGGSGSWLYGLDVAGARLLNHSEGRRPRRPYEPSVVRLRHTLGVTECYVLAREAELQGALELLSFEAEPGCWRSYPSFGGTKTLKPDAFVALGIADRERRWFIEVDRGTTSAASLRSKLGAYLAYFDSGSERARSPIFPRILWLVPNLKRMDVLRGLIRRERDDSQRIHVVALFDEAVEFLSGRRAQ